MPSPDHTDTSRARHPQTIRLLLGIITAVLCLLLVCYEALIWQWPLMREAHFLHYIGYLVNEHHFVPYRDVLETSWFGTFAFHMMVGKLFGYTAGAFRTVDVLWLLALMLVWWRILRQLDGWLASIACLSMTLFYLHLGPANTLQRDYLGLLPISLALLLALDTQHSAARRALWTGVLFGLAVTLKPHQLIGLPVIWLVIRSLAPRNEQGWLPLLAWTALGGTVVFGSGLLWLWWIGGLAPFLDMTFHYLPLYQSFDGAHRIVSLDEHLAQAWRWWRYFTWYWPLPIALGMWRGWALTMPGTPQRALVWGLPALALAYNLYPLPAGKFWDYHWIPYGCFAALASSLLLMPSHNTGRKPIAITLGCIAIFFWFMHSQYLPWSGLQGQIQRFPDIRIDTPYEDEMANFLREHTPAGGTVQTIDQGGPSTLWMIKAGSVLATPYLGSFMFLHDVTTPFVQHAQQDFLQRLATKPPALMIVMKDFTKPHGPGTLTVIPGLQTFIRAHYHPLRSADNYVIWERNAATQTATITPAESLPAPPPTPIAAPATPP